MGATCSCICIKSCGKNCGCRKAGLKCSIICGFYKGQLCTMDIEFDGIEDSDIINLEEENEEGRTFYDDEDLNTNSIIDQRKKVLKHNYNFNIFL